MNWWAVLLVASAGVPIARAWQANRRTALAHALIWGTSAWVAWLAAAAAHWPADWYVALALTACAGVAVLGARRPGVGAWHAVVAGLLAVLLLPLALDVLAKALPSEPVRIVFLSVVLLVGLVNYSPSRLGLGANTLLAACVLALFESEQAEVYVILLAGWAPWLAWLGLVIWPSKGSESDCRWRSFRDRFGVVWALRLREQFNRAAANADVPIELRWNGLHRLDGAALSERDQATSVELLSALMMRFN